MPKNSEISPLRLTGAVLLTGVLGGMALPPTPAVTDKILAVLDRGFERVTGVAALDPEVLRQQQKQRISELLQMETLDVNERTLLESILVADPGLAKVLEEIKKEELRKRMHGKYVRPKFGGRVEAHGE